MFHMKHFSTKKPLNTSNSHQKLKKVSNRQHFRVKTDTTPNHPHFFSCQLFHVKHFSTTNTIPNVAEKDIRRRGKRQIDRFLIISR